jgi:hypothetical protein
MSVEDAEQHRPPVDDAEKYRLRAFECVEAAANISDGAMRLTLLNIAQGWLRLAEQAEKNQAIDIIYTTTPHPKHPTEDC